jgi:hypothetical protein
MTYMVFTRNSIDHQLVHIISPMEDYFRANDLARRCGGSIMYADQFRASFTPSSPNKMNGTLRLG